MKELVVAESLSRRDAEMLQEMEKFAMDAALTATSTVTDALDDNYVQEEKVSAVVRLGSLLNHFPDDLKPMYIDCWQSLRSSGQNFG
jgi:hypothetical protein